MEDELFRHLLSLARKDDEAAADCLFAKAFPALRLHVLPMIDNMLRLGRLEAEDIIQDTYICAWKHLRQADFSSFPAFLGWLKTIARNKVTDMRRGLLAKKNDVRLHVQMRSPPGANSASYMDLAGQLAATQTTPSRVFAREEALAILAGQMWRLSEEYRLVIQCRFIQGMPVRDLAEQLGRSEPAVHMLCHRALKKLEALLGSPSKYLDID